MDKEHSKYIRATVSRLNYLLSDETERHGMLILLLNKLGSAETESEQSEMLKEVAEHMNLSSFDVLSDNPLYKRRRRRKFEDDLQEEEEPAEIGVEFPAKDLAVISAALCAAAAAFWWVWRKLTR